MRRGGEELAVVCPVGTSQSPLKGGRVGNTLSLPIGTFAPALPGGDGASVWRSLLSYDDQGEDGSRGREAQRLLTRVENETFKACFARPKRMCETGRSTMVTLRRDADYAFRRLSWELFNTHKSDCSLSFHSTTAPSHYSGHAVSATFRAVFLCGFNSQ